VTTAEARAAKEWDTAHQTFQEKVRQEVAAVVDPSALIARGRAEGLIEAAAIAKRAAERARRQKTIPLTTLAVVLDELAKEILDLLGQQSSDCNPQV
jgi:hypothetical protein